MSHYPKVAVTGCRPQLPVEFPINMPENAGNMIHAQAPLRMFSGAMYSGDPKSLGVTGIASEIGRILKQRTSS